MTALSKVMQQPQLACCLMQAVAVLSERGTVGGLLMWRDAAATNNQVSACDDAGARCCVLRAVPCCAVQVFMVSEHALLDEGLVRAMLHSGHSRVPVYRWVCCTVLDRLYCTVLLAPQPRRHTHMACATAVHLWQAAGECEARVSS